ncbi:efflux RND transporter permease subunit [Acidibrevibacterium fodinaquatile]|uniref:efflux RND transporter permease subunit n=1 Tax=Acidibrevibacterium fodinaquatile TaxID=1969806 RepID=UPI000E0D6025|nr:efflux RND transporter permease subunit [Acidibrevibacterium fodinaquatile]
MSGFNLSAWAVRHRALTGFLIALIFVAGAFSYTRLGRNEDPNFTLKLLVVSAQWPGATAAETQNLVADPIERKLQDLAHLDNFFTYVEPGLAVTMVLFEDSTPPKDVPELFYQTRKKLDDLRPNLPPGVLGPIVNDEYADVYGAVFALTGTDNAALTREAERVRDRFLKVPGAEKVTILGEIPRTIDVTFRQSRLAALGVTVPEIAQTIARQNLLAPAGLIQTGTTEVPLRVAGALAGPRSLAAVPITANGALLRLGDIAEIHRGYQDPPAFSIRHDGAPAVVVAVSTQPRVNRLAFGVALRAAAADIRADLPTGIVLQQIADQPKVIAESVDEFLLKFTVALGVVLLVSFFSLGWRTGIVVALAVPLTLSLVFVAMDLLGIELQRVSLGALIISLGLLVDDAIIAVETMVVKLEEGWERERAAGFAWQSTAFPMLTGTLVTAAGFLPIGFARSSTGEYAGGIFWVVAVALLASWVVAVVFTPYLGVLLLPQPKKALSHAAIYRTPLYRRLRRMVTFAVQYRGAVTLATVALFVLAVAGAGLVKQQFFPASARPELIVDVTLRQGASHAATEAAVAKVEDLLAKDRDVLWYTSYIGGGPPRFILSYNPTLPNNAVATIVMTTRDMAARERVRARLLAFAAGEGVPAARLHVSRIELGPAVGFPVQFRVMGDDLAGVRHAADQVLAALRETPGARDAQLAWGERAPSLRLALDQARVRELGLAPADIAATLDALLSGLVATEIRDGTKVIDVVLRAAPEERRDLAHLPDLIVPTAAGGLPLAQIARLEPQTEEPILWRRNRQPTLIVEAELQDGLQAIDVSAAAEARIRALALPPGVHVETGGAVEESAKANAALVAVFPVMVGALLLLLMIQLQDLRRVLLVLATMPLGLIGAVLALLLADAPFGFVALLGVIALGGMIMRNTIILVDQVRQDQAAGLPLREAIIESTVRRARPVVLTALAAALAFIPLSFNVFWGPMALAMIGGLLVATVLTLVFLPALYALAFRAEKAREAASVPVMATK